VGGDDKGASGATDLPIADRDRQWDAQAAVAGVRRVTDSEEAPSQGYKRGFFWYDSADADQFGAYKLPFAADVDNKLTAVPRGIFAAAAAVQGARGGVDIPEADREGVRSRIERYYVRMRDQFDDDSIVVPWEKASDQEPDQKAGRVFSAANAQRIRGAIDNAQAALQDLEAMLVSALGDGTEETEEQAKTAPGDDLAATEQKDGAGPNDSSPTSDLDAVIDVDRMILEIQSELSEVTQ
jgi:hypothetical protein